MDTITITSMTGPLPRGTKGAPDINEFHRVLVGTKKPGSSFSSKIAKGMKSWGPSMYALVCMVGIPILVYTFIPLKGLRLAFMVVSAFFGFVSFSVLLETITALLSTLVIKTADVNVKLDTDFVLKWPPIVYIIPAYLDNEAAILDDTLSAYKELRYQGSLTVMIVYNTRRNMAVEEAELTARWHNRQTGCMKVQIVSNHGCVPRP
jgi:hypothetical protein